MPPSFTHHCPAGPEAPVAPVAPVAPAVSCATLRPLIAALASFSDAKQTFSSVNSSLAKQLSDRSDTVMPSSAVWALDSCSRHP